MAVFMPQGHGSAPPVWPGRPLLPGARAVAHQSCRGALWQAGVSTGSGESRACGSSCFAATAPGSRQRRRRLGPLPSLQMWRGAFLAAQEAAGMILAVLLLCGLGQPGTAAPGSQGVKCVVFNDKYMTCMWGNQEDQPVANYSLYYWYQHQPVATECRRYLQHNGINIGCWFDDSEITPFQTFRVHINASLGSRTHVIPTYDMKLQDLVKPDPPVNLTLQNMSNHQLQLSWQTPYPKPHCMEYAVRYKSNKDTDWMVHRVSGELFSFPSIDEEKKYTFHVRSKISQYCGSTQLWSEWSVPVYWGNAMAHDSAGERYWVRTVLIPVVSGVVLLMLVVMLVRMERVWIVFMPQVPNPSKTFDELFNTHKGNFQEWAGVPKDVVESFTPNYSESICHVSELLPKEGQEPAADRSGPLPLKKDFGGL